MEPQHDYVVDIFFLLHWVLAIAVTLRVIMRRNSVGVALAWLTLVFFLPMAGSVLYIIFGEISVGRARTKRALRLIQPFKQLINDRRQRFTLDWSKQSEAALLLSRHATNTVNLPTLPGNDLELLDNCQDILRRMITDIQQATQRVHMEFYIWHLGGIADEVMAAVIEARRRGAHCRILLDSIGSHEFLKSELCHKARQAGVEIAEALPVDASVVLPDGTEVDGAVGLKAYLEGPARERFVASVVEHLFAYALGRDVVFSDDEELEAIARQAEAEGGTGRALLRAIVTSPSFRR